jgi:hypothetical protein
MSDSFVNDLVYLGKIIILTFFALSFIVIYNNKIMEGIILITLCVQILLLWLLIERYKLPDNLILTTFSEKSKKTNNYLHFILSILIFALALSFLFRILIITQFSYVNEGEIISDYYPNLIFSGIISIGLFGLFIFIVFIGNRYLKKNNDAIISQKQFQDCFENV